VTVKVLNSYRKLKKKWVGRVENENGKIGEKEKKRVEKCGWTESVIFSII